MRRFWRGFWPSIWRQRHGREKRDSHDFCWSLLMDSTQLKSVTIYTGGVSSVTGAGGYGVILICGDRRKELSGGCAEASNNRMDILAAVEGLRALKSHCT